MTTITYPGRQGERLFVIRDESGTPIAGYVLTSQAKAIGAFCYPSLDWSAYEASGWTCEPEPPQTTQTRSRSMTEEHTGLPVAGYRPQSTAKVDLVNANKFAEEQTLRMLDHLATLPDTDKRWLAIGRTAIETGFMSVNRSVFKPDRLTDERISGPDTNAV